MGGESHALDMCDQPAADQVDRWVAGATVICSIASEAARTLPL